MGYIPGAPGLIKSVGPAAAGCKLAALPRQRPLAFVLFWVKSLIWGEENGSKYEHLEGDPNKPCSFIGQRIHRCGPDVRTCGDLRENNRVGELVAVS